MKKKKNFFQGRRSQKRGTNESKKKYNYHLLIFEIKVLRIIQNLLDKMGLFLGSNKRNFKCKQIAHLLERIKPPIF